VKTEIGRMKELNDVETIKGLITQIEGTLHALEAER
jgi:hypothetical protein